MQEEPTAIKSRIFSLQFAKDVRTGDNLEL